MGTKAFKLQKEHESTTKSSVQFDLWAVVQMFWSHDSFVWETDETET